MGKCRLISRDLYNQKSKNCVTGEITMGGDLVKFNFSSDLFSILKHLDVKLDCDDARLGLQQLECPRDRASALLAASEDLTHTNLRPAQEL